MNYWYRYLILCWLATLCTVSLAQPTANYIINRTYKAANINENFTGLTFTANSNQANTQITYYDGLGKTVQQVMAFQAATKADVVLLTEYDNLQRPVRAFLPTALGNNGGLSQSAGDIKTITAAYYKDAGKVTAPIAGGAAVEALATQTTYETSPLKWINQQKAPGTTNGVTRQRGVNALAEVKYYRVTSTGLTDLGQQGEYQPGELTWERTADEVNGVSIQYQDRFQRIVLKRVASEAGNLDTYYVYDEKGLLRGVLQPKYQATGENDLTKQAFLYRYDNQGRLIEKKLPGANAIQMTYQAGTDLLKTLTDGKGQQFYYNYDNQNRQIEMGVNSTPLLMTYYDNYNFGPFQSYTNELGLTASQFADNPQNSPRQGLVTGTKARILSADGSYADWLQTVTYYDHKYRPIQVVRQLYGFNTGAFERISYQYSFDGKVEKEWTTQLTGNTPLKLKKQYVYDHADRLIKIDHELLENDISKKTYTHAAFRYNEVGQLAGKSLHGGQQTLTYKYTPRGWLGDHHTDSGVPFSLGLTYREDGNITGQTWVTQTYNGGMSFTYDQASRLTGAVGNGGFANYGESPIQYDNNGNITNLTRKYNNVVIDQLGYQYRGNQLHRIDDNNNNEGQAVKGYLNQGDGQDDEMAYDGNGNLIRDLDRKIGTRQVAGIAYNVLNLPRSVTRNGRTVSYIYDASGRKLKSEAPDNVNTFYVGAFEYRAESSLLRIGLEEGQLVKEGAVYQVHYYLRDHLGNVRSVVNDQGTVVQETDYYAFGLAVPRTGADKNKYLYNGKEKQPETEWLDYGARMYDPAVGRWMSVDPSTEQQESWSPYHYTYGNPIRFTDPDGRQPCCGDEIGGFAEGIGESIVRNVRALTTDLPQTLQGVANLTSPVGQMQTVIGAKLLYDKTQNDWNSGDTRTRANIIGNVVGEVAIAVASSKGAGSLGKAGVASDLAKIGEVSSIAKTEQNLGSLANPFKGKTLNQVTQGFEKQVESGKLKAVYADPVSGSKSYVNTRSKYSYNIDTGLSGKTGARIEPPHVDVNYPNPKPKNVEPKRKFFFE